MTTTPWKPVYLLNVKIKNKNMNIKWCSKDLFEKRKLEGWLPVSYKELAEGSSMTMQDGESLDTTVQRRNLILCKMPAEVAESRRKYFENQTSGLLDAEENLYRNNVTVGGYASGSYGNLEGKIKEGSDV